MQEVEHERTAGTDVSGNGRCTSHVNLTRLRAKNTDINAHFITRFLNGAFIRHASVHTRGVSSGKKRDQKLIWNSRRRRRYRKIMSRGESDDPDYPDDKRIRGFNLRYCTLDLSMNADLIIWNSKLVICTVSWDLKNIVSNVSERKQKKKKMQMTFTFYSARKRWRIAFRHGIDCKSISRFLSIHKKQVHFSLILCKDTDRHIFLLYFFVSSSWIIPISHNNTTVIYFHCNTR